MLRYSCEKTRREIRIIIAFRLLSRSGAHATRPQGRFQSTRPSAKRNSAEELDQIVILPWPQPET
jgi:hypothetical protein